MDEYFILVFIKIFFGYYFLIIGILLIILGNSTISSTNAWNTEYLPTGEIIKELDSGTNERYFNAN